MRTGDPIAGATVVVLSSDRMGRGDDQLGEVLLRNFLHTLCEIAPKPDSLICFNSGVKLAAKGSAVLEDLRSLEAQGVRILLCGTCLGHFGLKGDVAAGEISNMHAISEAMLGATSVVNL